MDIFKVLNGWQIGQKLDGIRCLMTRSRNDLREAFFV